MQGHLRVNDALPRLPGPKGERFVELFGHGSLSVELYAPHRTDPQKPHSRDEEVVFENGDVLFVAAGEVHRFVDFSQDFVAWVFFYGPEGGERDVSAPL
jgi:hypothetical protein